MQNNRSILAHAIPRGRRVLALASFLKPHMTDSKNSMQPLNRWRVAHGHFGNQSVVSCAMAAGFRHGVSANMDASLPVKDASSPSKFVFSHGSATVASLETKSSDWWHDYATKGQVTFIRGRLKFGGHVNSAPFPSATVVFLPNAQGEARPHE